MATPAQILANRTNSQRSAGPQTEAGKERSSQNSFKHGLTSSKIVLPGENPAEYDAFRAGILEQYQPANAIEQILVEELSAAGWRLNRSRAVETEVLKKLMGDAADSSVGLATVFVEKPKEFNRLLRYLTSIERAYYRVLDKLTRLQKERRAEEQAAAFEKAWVAQVKEEQQATEIKRPSQPLGSFRKGADVPRQPEKLSRFQPLNARRQATGNAVS
jgi:hypothetical protein